MVRLIDADALLDDAMDRYCKECDKRKGIKNGEYRIIYDIGEAPCRACEVDDMKAELEDAPTIDAVQVVRCKDCIHNPSGTGANHDLEFPDGVCPCQCEDFWYSWKPNDDWFCASGERKEE
ncbi:MAG: hypothetical protein IIX07_01650 [Lachnospiraceae bacterium]|nr:hypothetical protein [Lachnospiraceae bacterium]